jgi:hypothetical protein
MSLRRRERRRLQALMIVMSAGLVGPGLWNMVGHPPPASRLQVTVEHMEGPFEAVATDNGLATGALLPRARPGMHIAWVLQLSAPPSTLLDLDTRLMRQQDETVASWSHRQLEELGPDSRIYLLDQALPPDLKPGRYEIVQDISLRGAAALHRQLPSIPIDVLAGAGS